MDKAFDILKPSSQKKEKVNFKKSQKRSSFIYNLTFWLWTILIILGGIFIFLLYTRLSLIKLPRLITPKEKSLFLAPSPTIFPRKSPSLPPFIEKTPSPSPISEIEKSNLKITILNGSRITGAAARMKRTLENKGFRIKSIGNAKNYYPQSIIYYKKDFEKASKLVETALEKEIKKEENNQIVGTNDILIIIGKD